MLLFCKPKGVRSAKQSDKDSAMYRRCPSGQPAFAEGRDPNVQEQVQQQQQRANSPAADQRCASQRATRGAAGPHGSQCLSTRLRQSCGCLHDRYW